NDVRLLASGPRCGLGELQIPEVQPGSSIMPGKVNPVIAEALIMAVAQTLAADQAVLQSGQWGFFELNTMMPVAAHNFVQAVEVLGEANSGLAARYVRGDGARGFAEGWVRGTAATARGPEMVEKGLAICTGLVPYVGYDKAAAVAK